MKKKADCIQVSFSADNPAARFKELPKGFFIRWLLLFCLTAGSLISFAGIFELTFSSYWTLLFSAVIPAVIVLSYQFPKWRKLLFLAEIFLFLLMTVWLAGILSGGVELLLRELTLFFMDLSERNSMQPVSGILYDGIHQLYRYWNLAPYFSQQEMDAGRIFLPFFSVTLLSGILSVGILKRFMPVYLLILTIPFLESGLFFGLAPDYWAGALLLSGWGILLILWIPLMRRRKTAQNGKRIRFFGSGNGAALYRMTGAVTALVMVFSFLGAEKLFIKHPISRPESVTKLRNDWKNGKIFPDGFMGLDFIGQGAGGGSGGKLGQYDKITFQNQTHLRLKLGNTGNGQIYLRGYIGSRYTGDSWEPLPNSAYSELKELFEPGFSIQEISSQRMRELSQVEYFYGSYYEFENGESVRLPTSETSVMEIENVGASRKWSYTPYFYHPSSKFKPFYDMQPKAGWGRKSRVLYESPGFSWDTLEGNRRLLYEEVQEGVAWRSYYDEREQNYRSFVYQYYTDVPDSCLDAVKEFADSRGYERRNLYSADLQDDFEYHFPYTLAPGKLPRGEDFVSYFLTDLQKGYCTHFASAAVMIFRYLGYPARYVEGYVVSQDAAQSSGETEEVSYEALKRTVTAEVDKPGITVEVKDNQAHAWPEIYIPGLGWIPVEVTPGYGDGRTAADDYENDYPDPEESSEEPESSEPSESEPEESESFSEESNSSTPSQSEQSDSDGKGSGIFLKALISVLLTAAGILVLLWSVLLARVYALRRKDRKTRTPDNRENLREVYRQTENLLLCFGSVRKPSASSFEYGKTLCEEWEFLKESDILPLMESVMKLSYSSHPISDEEADAARESKENLIRKFYENSGRWRRFAMKYLWHFC